MKKTLISAHFVFLGKERPNIKNVKHFIEKKYTKAIEGVNCLLRHRISRFIKKTYVFSKELFNHIVHIELFINSINCGTAWSRASYPNNDNTIKYFNVDF